MALIKFDQSANESRTEAILANQAQHGNMTIIANGQNFIKFDQSHKSPQGNTFNARFCQIISNKTIGAKALTLTLTITVFIATPETFSQNTIRDRLRTRTAARNESKRGNAADTSKCEIAGLQCAVWAPLSPNQAGQRAPETVPAPLIIFSHGFKGSNTQSVFLMQALAKAGYLVIAPNHRDSMAFGRAFEKPEQKFQDVFNWDDKTYKVRRDDIVNLLAALKDDPAWSSRIDWTKVGLAGHSLGGYTVLGLGGAWPSWKRPEVKAVLALSPYCSPFSHSGNLGAMNVPVMYQGGTRDLGVTPTVKRPGGAFQKTGSPAYFVNFDKFGHFSWTGFNRDQNQLDLIDYYSVSFFDKYLKNDPIAKPGAKLPGVVELEVK